MDILNKEKELNKTTSQILKISNCNDSNNLEPTKVPTTDNLNNEIIQNIKEPVLEAINLNQTETDPEIIPENKIEEKVEATIEEKDNAEEKITVKAESIEKNISEFPTTNCLALTIREEHKLVAVKNVFLHSLKVTWKVIVSTIALHILNLFF